MKQIALLALSGLLLAAAPAPAPKSQTPTDILNAAPTGDWQRIDPNDLLVIDLAGGRRVVIALAPAFAPVHAANIRALARARWFDGIAIDRVQDNYVVQWGDADETKTPLAGLAVPPAEYDRPAAGLPLTPLPYRDAFAPRVGYSGGFPVAEDGGRAWMTHCYGIVGVGRGYSPDTGSGAELYAVIGHSPRALDRNIALVGRVIDGFDAMTALPRGTGPLGFYEKPEQRLGITHVSLAADLPADARPAYEWLRPDSASFKAWLHLRANRHDDFFIHPAGAIDLCNAMSPVRPAKG
jgi:peptidylprolyl isomerase